MCLAKNALNRSEGVGTKFLLFVYTATKFSINKQLAFILAYKTVF